MNGITVNLNLVPNGTTPSFTISGSVSHLVMLLEVIRLTDPARVYDPHALASLEKDLKTLLKTVRAAE